MQSVNERKSIPPKLHPLLSWERIWKDELNTLIKATNRFIEWIMEGDYQYDTSEDADLQQLETLLDRYYQHIRWSKAPHNIGLLNTQTYRDIHDPRNPHFAEKIRVFWLGKKKEKRTKKEKDRFVLWLRKIALIDEDHPERIEAKADEYINRAIRHINRDFFSEEMLDVLGNESKSPFHHTIHKENSSVLGLLELAQKYLSEYRQSVKAKEPTDQDLRARSDRNKALYEIARIFAFASMYVHIEHIPGQENRSGDKLFLVSEVLELTENPEIEDIRAIMDSDNPFFDHTTTNQLYWRKNEQGGYEYSEKYVSKGNNRNHSARLESIKLTWSKDTFGKKWTVSIQHIDFRNDKAPESVANKVLRKELDSPKEVLDTRGFRFVVETEDDAQTLLNMLAYNLSSGPETAWSEKPKWEKNGASGNNFRCLKWTLKIFHKRIDTKHALNHIRDNITDPLIQERLSYLFSDKWHILETEIQIFVGTDSYIAAHHDKTSPAFAGNYKLCQHLDEASRMFPPNIFPETHTAIIGALSTKETERSIKRIREKLFVTED